MNELAQKIQQEWEVLKAGQTEKELEEASADLADFFMKESADLFFALPDEDVNDIAEEHALSGTDDVGEPESDQVFGGENPLDV